MFVVVWSAHLLINSHREKKVKEIFERVKKPNWQTVEFGNTDITFIGLIGI